MKLDPETIHRRIAGLLHQRKGFIVASILEVKGSCPQVPGKKMIVHSDGSFEFTIGGGSFEAEVIQDARAGRGERFPFVREYKLTKQELGMYCQGLVKVMFETYHARPRLIIFGGGHVGEALGRLVATTQLFEVVVIDDRKKYAAKNRHSTVDGVFYTDRMFKRNVPAVDENSYLVVVTRCHATDKLLIKRYVESPAVYLGLIGSRAKVKQFRKELIDEGISAPSLDRLRAPIGLPIGGKDPAEVAVSILAELIQVKNQRESLAVSTLQVTNRHR
jgi:xanthine dehydrogenase accessory factor